MEYSLRLVELFLKLRRVLSTPRTEKFLDNVALVDLPKDIVDAYQDKYMIVTGFEVDVKRINESTEKGVCSSVSILQSSLRSGTTARTRSVWVTLTIR